jgi:hypothetical protein
MFNGIVRGLSSRQSMLPSIKQDGAGVQGPDFVDNFNYGSRSRAANDPAHPIPRSRSHFFDSRARGVGVSPAFPLPLTCAPSRAVVLSLMIASDHP